VFVQFGHYEVQCCFEVAGWDVLGDHAGYFEEHHLQIASLEPGAFAPFYGCGDSDVRDETLTNACLLLCQRKHIGVLTMKKQVGHVCSSQFGANRLGCKKPSSLNYRFPNFWLLESIISTAEVPQVNLIYY
jgi:hypothetical protein